MKKIINSIIVLTILAALFLTACGSTPKSSDGALSVLASTTFLADITQNIAGDRIQVDSLLPFGADPHDYQAVPADVTKISESNLLIRNGLEYEHFLQPMLDNASGTRLIITTSDGLTPNTMEEDGVQVNDPHMWLDPTRVVKYVENIRDGLIKADPNGADTYKANADAYIAKLKDLDVWVKEQVNTIHPERRLLVTNHDAMGYFAEHYGFNIIGAIIPSTSDDASTSAQEMGALVDQIKSSSVTAIFLDAVENPKLANQIAAETGVKVVDDLHVESLTDGSPAGSYLEMMKYNVFRIVDALK